MSRKNIWHFPVAIIVVLVTMLIFGGITASADSYSGECGAEGDNLTWEFSGDTLTISGTGAMKDYNYYDPYLAPWYQYRSNLKYVVIESGVTSVGNYAFYECRQLETITFPNTLKRIGDYSFQCLDSLTTAQLPDSLESVGRYAFNQTHLTSVYLGENVTTISEGAFSGGFDLQSVTISGKNLRNIGKNAFSSCQELVSVTFSEDANYRIEDDMFSGCCSLSSVTIPNGVTGIGRNAFYGCGDLKEITIPDSVTSIEDCAFQNSGLTSVTIPGSVEIIEEAAFEYCTELTAVTINEGVIEIEYNAFSNCPLLTKVSFPGSLTLIDDSAFSYCGLTSISISGTDLVIEDNAFAGCENLKYVELLDGVKKLDRCFYECHSLETVVFPSTLKEITPYAFYDCEAVTDIYCYADAADFEWYYYSNSWKEYYNFGYSTPKLHVKESQLSDYYAKYSELNVVFIGDLDQSTAGINARLIGHSVTLADLIGVNFYLNLSSAENVTVAFSWGVGDYAKTAKGTLVPVDQYGANYKVTCGVAARCLTDNITMEVMRGDELILKDSFSVCDYIKILGKSTPYYNDPTLHELLYALEIYGADSQTYFGYRTDEPLPDDYFTYAYGIIDDNAQYYVSDYKRNLNFRTDLLIPDMPLKSIGDRDIGLSYYAASAVCASQTKIRLYFVVTDEAKFAEVKATFNSKTLKFRSTKIGTQDVVFIETSGLCPAELLSPVVVTIAGVDYEYDFKDYLGKALEGTSESLMDVTMSLYTYAYYANRYKEAHNG